MVVITEYYTGTRVQAGQAHRRGLDHRPRARTSSRASACRCRSPRCPCSCRASAILVVVHARRACYGIAIAATSMLSMAGIIVALDAFGPITDNAGGIAEMANLPDEVRDDHRPARRRRQHHEGRHQGLRDRLGRPRRAGAVRRLHARRSTSAEAGKASVTRSISSNPWVIIGLFIGGLMPFLFARYGDGGRRPRGRRRGGRGGAPPVPRDPGHHGRHAASPSTAPRRHR